MADYGKVVSEGIRFAFQPKRWVHLFALDAITASVLLSYLLVNANALTVLYSGQAMSEPAVLSSMLGIGVAVSGLFVVWILIRMYIVGALIYQSVNPGKSRESWRVSKERYLNMIMVTGIVSLASFVAGVVPYVGWAISILAGLAFFFAMPPVIIDRKHFDECLRISVRMFREKTADVAITWLLVTVLSLVLVGIFSIPAFAMALVALLPALIELQGETSGRVFLDMMVNNAWAIYPAILVSLVGFAISNVFSLFFQTNMYRQLSKKKLL